MNSKNFTLFSFLTVLFTAGLQFRTNAASVPAVIDKETLVPFLKKYCYECHNDKKSKGDFSLNKLSWQINDNVMARHWQDLLDVMNSGEMPPEDEKQPAEKEFKEAVRVLTENLTAARKNLASSGGVYKIRRLTEREYQNTIKHLFGLNIDAAQIPDDIRSMEFDTAGNEQYFDSSLLENYLRLGKDIVKEGFRWSGQPYAKSIVKKYEAEENRGHEIYGKKMPFGKSGYYLYRGNRNSDTVGALLGDDPRASYLIRVKAGLVGNVVPAQQYLEVFGPPKMDSSITRSHGIIKISGTEKKPGISEVFVPRLALGPDNKPKVTVVEVGPVGPTNFGRWWPKYLKELGVEKDKPRIWVDCIEVEGPVYSSKKNVFGDLINRKGANLGTPEKARDLLRKFAFEAFRRVEPGSVYIDKLEAYFNARMKELRNYEEAMSETIALILASPGFLYIEENNSVPGLLDPRAFATRLSYFLWSAPPDEELYAAAADGSLLKKEGLKRQVDRMLNDSRAESFYDGFMSQWLQLDRLDGFSVAWEKNIRYNSGIRYSSYKEPVEFFKYLIKENLGAENFIDSPFAVVNHQMAYFYGIDKPESSSEFEAVKLPAGSPRGGILTQSAFLSIGSSGERSSPVIRGTLILEKLLNSPPPPPPPNVPELETASDKPLTNRQMVEMHRRQRQCASCHDKIDPIGFGLENFNAVGLWRDTEKVGNKDIPIDPGAVVNARIKFKDLAGLQKLLKARVDSLSRNLIESMLAYGIGRRVEFSDKDELDLVASSVKTDANKLREMIFHVVNSKVFRAK